MPEKTIKPTSEQIEVMRKYWKLFQQIEEAYFNNIDNLQDMMSKEAGIKELIFFSSDGAVVGIGNEERTMNLIQRDELE